MQTNTWCCIILKIETSTFLVLKSISNTTVEPRVSDAQLYGASVIWRFSCPADILVIIEDIFSNPQVRFFKHINIFKYFMDFLSNSVSRNWHRSLQHRSSTRFNCDTEISLKSINAVNATISFKRGQFSVAGKISSMAQSVVATTPI